MTVLTILGFLIAAAAVFGFIGWFNGYTEKTVNYCFFTMEHTALMCIGYLMIFFGNSWMQEALDKNGDWLNGALIVAIGTIILIAVIINNFKKNPAKIAIQGSIAQIILYIPIAYVSIFLIMMALAFFSQIRPVYSINSRD